MEENQNQQEQQEQLETVDKAQYDALLAELEEVKGKLPKEPTEEEIALQAKQQELFVKEINLTLRENGLDQFASIIKVSNENELKEVIQSLTQIVNDIKVTTGYVPKDNAKQNEYDVFAQKGDTKGMIANKLSKLFG